MQVVDDLIQEHRVIEDVLSAWERITQRIARDPRFPPPDTLADISAFLGEFVDAIHHQKEEEILFEAVSGARLAPDGVHEELRAACLVQDHKLGRMIAGWIAELVARRAKWNQYDRDWYVERAVSYVALLRAHIDKEDSVFFPDVERRLKPGGRELVEKRYRPGAQRDARQRWIDFAQGLRRTGT